MAADQQVAIIGAPEHVACASAGSYELVATGGVAYGIAENVVPIVEVAFKDNMWWSIPFDISQAIVGYMQGGSQGASWVYDWGENGRPGTYYENGMPTRFSRYIIDFDTMTQTNSDTHNKRKVRIVYMRREDAEKARVEGQKWK